MANRESQIGGTRKAHHGGTEIAEPMPQFANGQGLDPTVGALCGAAVRDWQANHGEFDLRHDQRTAIVQNKANLGLARAKAAGPLCETKPISVGRMKANCVLEKGLGEKGVDVAGAKTKPICRERHAYGDPKRVLSRLGIHAGVSTPPGNHCFIIPAFHHSIAPSTGPAGREPGAAVRNKANFGGRKMKASAVGNKVSGRERGLWRCGKQSQYARPGAASHGAAVRNEANFPVPT